MDLYIDLARWLYEVNLLFFNDSKFVSSSSNSSMKANPSQPAATTWPHWRAETVPGIKLRILAAQSLPLRTIPWPTARKASQRRWNLSRSPRSSHRNLPWPWDLVSNQSGLLLYMVYLNSCFTHKTKLTGSNVLKNNFSVQVNRRHLSWNSSVLKITLSTSTISWTSPSPWKTIWKMSRTSALTSWGKCKRLLQILELVRERHSPGATLLQWIQTHTHTG